MQPDYAPMTDLPAPTSTRLIGASRSEKLDVDSVPEPPAELRFSRDDRPVDGALKELVIVRNADGTYDATLRTAFFDRINGVEVDETESIGSGLTRG
jgi:hypothetical protein